MSRLYELTDGWEWKPLKDICKFENGDRGKNYPSKSAFVESGIPVISATNLNGWTIDKNGLNYINEDRYNLIGSGKIKIGDILFCLRGSLGKCALVTDLDKGAIASSLVIVRPLDNLSTQLLMYYFNSNLVNEYINKYNNGSAQPNLSAKSLSLFEFPLPPLLEQQRIVSKLDLLFEKIDRSIALHQKNMDEANAFMGSVLNDVFGELEERYGLIKINDTVVKTNNVNPLNHSEKPFTYIDISSINNKSFKITKPKQLIGKEAPSRAKKEVILGDVVYSTTRPNLKNIAIVNEEYDNPIASTGFCVLRVNNETINSYLFYYLITNKLFEQIEPNIRGAQYPATSDKDLKNCDIPNTPYKIQQKVVNYMDDISQKIEKIKELQKEKMDSLKALKASILDSAFRGEL